MWPCNAPRGRTAPAGANSAQHVQPGDRGDRPNRYGWTLQLVNNRLCKIVRRPARNCCRCGSRIAVPEDAPYLRDLLQQAIQTGEGFAIEVRHVLPDGSRLWLRNNVSAVSDQGGAVRHLMAVIEDVTARRKTEEGLQRAHDDMRKAAQERAARLHQGHRTPWGRGRATQTRRGRAPARHRRAPQGARGVDGKQWRFRMLIQGVTDYAIFMLDKDGLYHQLEPGRATHPPVHGDGNRRRTLWSRRSDEEQQRGEPARALRSLPTRANV